MSVRYAYLKPAQGDSPFYVHLTLDGAARTLRLYWHMSWWKNEDVSSAVFDRWLAIFRTLTPLLDRSKHKERKNSYRLQGRCQLSSAIFRDLIGFVEADTQAELPAKLEGYVNAENKIVEVDVTVAYRPLGSLPRELLKLNQVFTANPDYETVRSKLVFFDPCRIVNFPGQQEPTSADPPPWPSHQGSPDIARRLAELPVAPLSLADEFCVDPTLDTSQGHPYALPLVEPAATTTTAAP